MNCCDYDCHQGRDCPARVAKVGQRIPAAQPLPSSPWHAYMRHLAKWMLIVIGALLGMAMWLMLIAVAPRIQRVDCSIAEISPDYTAQVRKACRGRPTT